MRHLPLVTGVLLAALVVVPLWLRQHTGRLRERVTDVALPARNALLEVQIAFASELAAIRGYELTGDTSFLSDFTAGIEKDRDATQRLLHLSTELGPEAAAAVSELDARKQSWLEEPNAALAGKRTRAQLIQSLSEGERRVDGVLQSADRANAAVIAAEASMRQTVADDERTAAALVVLLGLAALAVVIVVGWLVHRLNLLAAELRHGVDEEASLHHVAGTLNGAASIEELAVQVTEAAVGWTTSSGAYLERVVGTTATIAGSHGSNAPAANLSIPFEHSATAASAMAHNDSTPGRPHASTVELVTPGDAVSHHALVVPLRLDSGTFGSLVLLAGKRPWFAGSEIAYAIALSDLVTAALGRILLIEREQRARKDAEDAVRYRDQMLRVVSHDLKNPLHTIGMIADLLGTMELSESERANQLRIVTRTVERMSRLIHDLLDAARVQSGHALPISASAVDTRDLLTEITDMFSTEAREKNIRLECDAGSAPLAIFADRDRLLQVFSNLIGNAVKVTREGGRISIGGESDGQGGVKFTIADTGTGIPAEDLPHLFEPFWQAHDLASLGTGLGLSIVRGIVEAHGGQITAESVPGEGTTFIFTLPASKHPPISSTAGPPNR